MYQTDRDIQRGILLGMTYEKLDVTTYVFNPDDSKPTVVVAVSRELVSGRPHVEGGHPVHAHLSINPLKFVLEDEAGDVGPELRADVACGSEMDAGKDPGVLHLFERRHCPGRVPSGNERIAGSRNRRAQMASATV